MEQSRIDVRSHDDAWMVELHGDLDAGDVPAFNRALAPIVDDHGGGVVIDLSGVRMLDSTMLGALVGWQGHARRESCGPVLFVAAEDSAATRLLGVVLGGEVPIYRDIDEALGAAYE